MTTNLDNDTLEWAAQWIEGSLKGEDDKRVREFGNNMAMTLRAAKIPAASTPAEEVIEKCLTYCRSVLDVEEHGYPKDISVDDWHYQHCSKQTAMIDAAKVLISASTEAQDERKHHE